MDTSKIIDVLCQIVGGGTVGIITYWISSKLWPASVKKDAMEHTLEYALMPIQKILKPIRLLSIEDIFSDIKEIDEIMNNNPFDIPPLHRCKVDDIKRFIKLYNDDTRNQKILEKKIRSEYASYVSMFHIQCNYVKKQLGYPYSNFYDALRYETGSPVIATLFLLFIAIMLVSVYVVLFLQNEPLKATIIFCSPAVLFLIYAIIYRILKNRGGIRVVISNFRNRKSGRLPNDSVRQKQKL